MKVNPKIFKAYDIRGVYPAEINGQTAYKIGRAFVEFLKKPQPKIVVARDGRFSSPVLRKNLVKGLVDSGAVVFDLGLATTPTFYFSAAHYGYDGGINITASHNPKEYNGFKLVRENAFPIGENTGLRKIKDLAMGSIATRSINGSITKKKAIRDYLRFNLKEVNAKNLKPLKIIIDTANAVPGILIPYLAKSLPLKIHHLFKEIDGSFPNHSPDPLKKENIAKLCSDVKKRKADFGVAFDGDGDRVVFIDENGRVVSADIIIALMAELILRKNPRRKILYDIRSSRAVKEVIKENGGIPVIWRVGHSFIKEKMRKEGIIFGGEFSGHYYHQRHYFCEAPLFVLLKIIELISASGKTLSQLIKSYQRYYHSGEINFEVEDKAGKVGELKKRFSSGEVLEIDGLRVDFEDWWFNVRPSNTEPLLRLVIEAKTKKLLEHKKKELSALISS